MSGDAGTDGKSVCPEHHCGIKMNTRTELEAHLQWDHNRSEYEANAMLDDAGIEPKSEAGFKCIEDHD